MRMTHLAASSRLPPPPPGAKKTPGALLSLLSSSSSSSSSSPSSSSSDRQVCQGEDVGCRLLRKIRNYLERRLSGVADIRKIVEKASALLCKKKKVVYPTSIANVHLVMGCPNARAGVKTVK